MTTAITRGEVREQTTRAVITRADGTVEDLGVIAHYHRNPLLRFAYRLGIRLKRIFNG